MVVLYNVVPPITDLEYENSTAEHNVRNPVQFVLNLEIRNKEYLGLGPKQRINGKITVEEVGVSCEEAKVKMLWNLRNNVIDSDGDDVEENVLEEGGEEKNSG